MKALITGISGFSGRHLAKLLKAEGLEVTGIDLHPGEYLQADLTDKEALQTVIKQEKPDYIFHLASPLIRSGQLLDEALIKNLKVDLFGTVNLIEAAAALTKKPRILITGTAAEYDVHLQGPRKETDRLNPNTSYGLSKLTQELVSQKLAASYGLEIIYTRSFLLIGPGQKPGFVVNDWCRQLAQKTHTLVTGNLSIKRDFTDVRDGVRAYYQLMIKGQPGKVYNVCSGKSLRLQTIVQQLRKLVPQDFKVDEDKKRFNHNDPLELFGDNTSLKALGWQPKIDLQTSLTDTLNYWRKEAKA